MRISFEGKDLLVIVQEMNEFLGAYQGLMSTTPDVVEEKPDPTKKQRRGRGKAKSTPTIDTPTEETPEPTKTRRGRAAPAETTSSSPRRGRKAVAASAPPEGSASARGRRGKTSAPSTSDIKDADLIKACSTLAQATSPTIVTNLLEEFKVNQVSELEGDARREFLTATAEMAA